MTKRRLKVVVPSDSAGAVAEGIGIVIGLIIVGVLSYKALSIELLRPFAIGGLAIVVGCVIFVAALMLYGFRPRMRSSSSKPLKPLREIDPQISENLYNMHSARAKINSIVGEHLETLARRRLMLVKVDHYGIVDGSEWNKEVQRFVNKVVRPNLSTAEAEAIAPKMNETFQEMIEDRVRLRSDEIESELQFSRNVTPELFEHWCTKTLNASGWKLSQPKPVVIKVRTL